MTSWPLSDADFLGVPLDFEAFAEGWAYAPRAAHTSAHFFIEQGKDESPFFGANGRVKFFKSLCGTSAASTRSGPLFAAGKATRCARCEKSARKAGK